MIFSKIKSFFTKASDVLFRGIDRIFAKNNADVNDILNELTDFLISLDVGYSTTHKLISNLKSLKFNKNDDIEHIKSAMKKNLMQSIYGIFEANKYDFHLSNRPTVIVFVGINGNGKTTSVAKLAAYYKNKNVVIASCDTFRAGANEQLRIWAKRTNTEIVENNGNMHSATIAFQTVRDAKLQNKDIVIVDTAGRLHNNINLMDELGKINRAIKKADNTAPHHVILTIDATTGQNAYRQVEQFTEYANVTSLFITKVDVAKPGILIGILDKWRQMPISFLGSGEGLSDIEEFNAMNFIKDILYVE